MSKAEPDAIRVERIEASQSLLLREMRLRSLAQSPDAFGQPLEEARGTQGLEWDRIARRSAQGDSNIWLFAYRGDEAVGLVQGRKRRPASLLLFSMWIDASARRRGLGRRLVAELERWAVRWNAAETILWVYAGNRHALRFYRDLGFEVIATGEDVDAGARFGALAMRRPIEASSHKLSTTR